MIQAVKIGKPLRVIRVTPKELPLPGSMPAMPAPAEAPKVQPVEIPA